MQVTASDGDKDRPQNIVYFLTGQGIFAHIYRLEKFSISSKNLIEFFFISLIE